MPLPVTDERVQVMARAIEPFIVGTAEHVAKIGLDALILHLEDKTKQNAYRYVVTLTRVNPDKKIHAIKFVRTITTLGLKEAKDIVDAVDGGRKQVLSYNATETEANDAKRIFATEGHEIEVEFA